MIYNILHILCEGQTEERFVKEVLSPYLQQFNIYPKPILLLTSKKKNARGGMLSYAQAKRDLTILQKQFRDNNSEHHLFTTMFDYYALPDDFPGVEESIDIQDVRSRISFLEDKFAEELGGSAFIPYIQLHEFEALLFVDIIKLQTEYPLSSEKIRVLKKETDIYGDPEMINNSPDTAPSKRIIAALSQDYHYNKVQSGATVTSAIGIEALLENCQHFKEWIENIKRIVAQ
ncbi:MULTISPECIES: DUF4276 family protein [Bacteroides]|uniref:DUF4276 family protein n=1 Tax=Bacteroides TaxID=816 RepID=UPI0025B2850E|nr:MULTISPECIES: DUF4276 family protein [Bacteroides]